MRRSLWPQAILTLLFACSLAPAALATQDELGRRPLEHEDYDRWNSVRSSGVSPDGAWVAFTVRPAEGDGTLTIRKIATQEQFTIERGTSANFTRDSRYAIYLVRPAKKEGEESSRGGAGASLEILDLETERTVSLPGVRSFRLPEEASGWIAYPPSGGSEDAAARKGASEMSETYSIASGELEPAGPVPAVTPEASEEPGGEPKGEAGKKEAEAPSGSAKAKPSKRGAKKGRKDARTKKNGSVLVLRDLATGMEQRIPDVTSHRFSKYGRWLVYATSATDAEDDGVFAMELATGEIQPLITGRGAYQSIAISEDEKRVTFLTDRDDYGPEKPSMSLYHWAEGDESAAKIAGEETDGIPEGWWIAASGPRFTEDNRRILFSTQPRPEDAGKTKSQLEKEKKAKAKDPVVKLDIWHWKDDALQPRQLLQAEQERRRSYQALFDIEAGRVVQLATREMPSVRVDGRSSSDMAVGTSSARYAVSESWESPGFSDSYVVDLKTGEARLVLERVRGTASLSPAGRFLTWWDPDQRKMFAMPTGGGDTVDLSEGIPTSLANELHDTPAPPRSYRTAGWLDEDAALLIYDRFDIWQVDPTGAEPARCLTGERGRAERLRYRYQSLDREARSIDPAQPMLLTVFNEGTKASGVARLDPATGEITTLLMLDERIGAPVKAKDADTLVMTRQTFRRYPDLWATTTAFESLKRLSWANPQQREYLWGTAELVQYETTEGVPLDGILYKPDNFDPTRKYPMMVYFYERNSDNLHRYVTPSAGSSSINYAFYVSRGYVLFVPDIPYTTGEPGISCANAVLPGVQSIVDMGFVDPDRIGVQGHSWGGYQIAYLVTMTNVFACAESGAPVSNMTSAYGGIRWASGLSRMFQYEKTQSRIGGTLWEARDLYLKNSPVFYADKIETPLLILHNDEDGAVPWYQGIELFVAMRRLGKPAWMLNYNGEAHGLRRKENRVDFARRMQQFFDHYLMDGPATRWIAEGVPAVDKGREFGFEPVLAPVVEEAPAEAVPEGAASEE